MGFGTGLNALLTFLHLPAKIKVHYTAIEAYPLKKEIIDRLEHEKFLGIGHDLAQNIVQAPFGTTTVINENFSLTKVQADFTIFETSQRFDLIYYDAFGPKIQPELWTLECMEKCARLLNPGGILVTYCSQGQFRRNLKAAGFSVEKLPGPPGKREITRATKI
jgi:tRNA U34 5-methylaminomethyl-2-thiouridine-forming methyltransferase MnmC